MKKTQIEQNENEIMVVPVVKDIEVPTNKLNTTQRKEYKEYAERTILKIRDILSNIDDRRRTKFIEENKQKLMKETLKENDKAVKDITNYLKVISDIKTFKETKEKDLRKQFKRIEDLTNKFKNELQNLNFEIKDKFSKSNELRESLKEKYDYEKCPQIEIDRLNEVSLTKNSFDDNGEYYIKKICLSDYKMIDFIDEGYIIDTIDKLLETQNSDIKNINAFIDQLSESVEDAMLFSDGSISKVFESLIKLREKVKALNKE